MQKSLEMFGEVRRLLPGGQQATSKLVYAHPMAGANAVITLLMGQEVKSHFAKQLGDPERALDFFPAFAGGLWSNAGLEEIMIRSFLGISDWHRREKDVWGQHHNHLKDLKCVDAQGNEQSCVRIQVEVDSPAPPTDLMKSSSTGTGSPNCSCPRGGKSNCPLVLRREPMKSAGTGPMHCPGPSFSIL
jgi:hypothetical protein